MIRIQLNNEMLEAILEIERNKDALNLVKMPANLSNRFRKNTKKRSSYASNRIEGNPLTYEQADAAIESKNRHFLKPEQEVRNYYLALEFLEEKLKEKEPLSLKLLLEAQKRICEGEPRGKIGLRGAMPAGVFFAIWNDDGTPAYIPPECDEVPSLLEELFTYVNESDDHPILKAAVIHYQLVTIHPFEDGNGRTARILSSYYLSLNGYGFKNVGSLEEYMSYDIEEYYDSLQMGLPVLYYDGRNDPPHPEKWIQYYLKVFRLYASKVLGIAKKEVFKNSEDRLGHLSKKARAFLDYLKEHDILRFAPIDIAAMLGVSNRTVINWSAELSNNGFLKPILAKKRIRQYERVDG